MTLLLIYNVYNTFFFGGSLTRSSYKANLNLKDLNYKYSTNLSQVIHCWKPGLQRIIIMNSTYMLQS